MSEEYWGARLTKERAEWKATAETQTARAEEFRAKCETAYREGYAAAMSRLGEEAKLDEARADGLRARILSPSCLAGPSWAAADAGRAALSSAQPPPTGSGALILGRAVAGVDLLSGAPVLASNPLDTRTPDYHQLAEDLFAAVREMLRQKERADRAEQGAREADAARRIVEFSDARIRGERDAAEAEVTSLTARMEQVRGRVGEATAVVREQLAGMWNDALEAAAQAAQTAQTAQAAQADLGVVPPGPFAPSGLVAADFRLDGEASHNTAWRIIVAIRDLKTPVDG